MFGNILKKLSKVVDATEQIDDRFYAEVMDEISQGFKDKAAAGKAIAQSDGIESKFESLYVKIRAAALQDKFNQSLQQESISSVKMKYKEGYFEQLFKNQIKELGYYSAEVGDVHDFIRNGKEYRGKIDSFKMIYYLEDDDNKYEDSFSI